MRSFLSLLAAIFLAAPAAAHPGIGDGAVHDTMHLIGGLEGLLVLAAVGLVAWAASRRLRSRRIGRK